MTFDSKQRWKQTNSLIVTKQFELKCLYNLHTENPFSEMEVRPKQKNFIHSTACDYSGFFHI